MFANFTKDEFHEWFMLYTHKSLKLYKEDMLPEGDLWYEFIEFISTKQIEQFFNAKLYKYTPRVRSLGKVVGEGIIDMDNESKVKIMY